MITMKKNKKLYSGGGNITLVNYWGRRYGSEKDVFWKDADIFVFQSCYHN